MLLYLLRHADADTVAARDDDRALSEKGIAQAKRVAEFCAERGIELTRVVTSPVRRALETAELVARPLGLDVAIAPWLACGMTPRTALAELKKWQDETALVLVGHEPDFSDLAAHLLGLPAGESIHLRKASLTLLVLEAPLAGTARLDFSLPARLM